MSISCTNCWPFTSSKGITPPINRFEKPWPLSQADLMHHQGSKTCAQVKNPAKILVGLRISVSMSCYF
jgi:hypothetical protein